MLYFHDYDKLCTQGILQQILKSNKHPLELSPVSKILFDETARNLVWFFPIYIKQKEVLRE